jgi:diacylglycerol kinase family enzyme
VSDWRNKLPSAYDYRESARARNTGERFACVVNPKAKAGEVGARLDEIRRAVDRAFEQWEVFVSEGPGHATELTQKAIEAGYDIVAALGGDGTCNEVVNGFFNGRLTRRRSTVYSILPWGTGSDLAKTLRAPGGLEDALWVASTGMTLPTDVGHIDGLTHDGRPFERVFINVLGFGANGDVVDRVNKGSKRLGGKFTFYKSTVDSLMQYKPGQVKVEWEGPDGPGEWTGELLSGFLANGAYCGGGMHVGRGGSMHDGAFDLTLLPNFGLLGNVARSWRLYDGSVWKIPGARRAYATKVTARGLGDEPVLLDVDGEQPGILPATISVLPKSLMVRGGWIHSPLLQNEREVWRPETA